MTQPRRPKPRKIIDVTPEPVKPKKPQGLPAPRTKKVEITSGKEVVREVEIAVEDPEIQDGDMVNAVKAGVASTVPAKTGYATVGLGLGATLNMGDYQSARVDCFIIRNVPDNEAAIDQAMNDISKRLNHELQRQSLILTGDE